MGLDGKKTKLEQGDIFKVDFVPAGAQPDAKVALYKGIETIEDLLQGTTDQLSVELQQVAKIGKAISGDRMNRLKTICDQLQTLISEALGTEELKKEGNIMEKMTLTEEQVIKMTSALLSPESIAKALESIGVEMPIAKKTCSDGDSDGEEDAKKESAKKKFPKKDEDSKKEEDDEEEAKKATPGSASAESTGSSFGVKKQANENDVSEKIAKMDIELKSYKQQIAKMIDEQQTRQYVTKAAEFDCIPIETGELGSVLKSVATVDTETYNKIENILKTANEIIKQSVLFSETGYSSSDVEVSQMNVNATNSEDAWTQIETLASAMVTKGSMKTQSDAIDHIMKSPEGKRLYAIYTGKISYA